LEEMTKPTNSRLISAKPPTMGSKKKAGQRAAATPKVSNPQTFEKRFDQVRKLGHGSYGTVWLVKQKSDQQLFAMKSVSLPPLASHDEKAILQRRQALREVETLQQLQSSYVVRYVDMILSPASAESPQSELHIVTEYCEAGDLKNYLRKKGKGRGLAEDEVWSLSVPVLFGLHDLHQCRILHRDVKLANILLKRQTKGGSKALKPLLADLGLARHVSDSQPLASTQVGTPHYCAPEIFEGAAYGEKADIYSFGVCIYELMHGKTPHADVQNIAGLVKRVLRLDLGLSSGLAKTASIDASFSSELRDFVSACLEQNPEARPDTAKLVQKVPDKYCKLCDTRPFDGSLSFTASSVFGSSLDLSGSNSSLAVPSLSCCSEELLGNKDLKSTVADAERTQRPEAKKEATLHTVKDSPDMSAGISASRSAEVKKEITLRSVCDSPDASAGPALDKTEKDAADRAATLKEVTLQVTDTEAIKEIPDVEKELAQVLQKVLLEQEPQRQDKSAEPEAKSHSAEAEEVSDTGSEIPDERSGSGADDAGGPTPTPLVTAKQPPSPARKSPAQSPPSPMWRLAVAPPAAAALTKAPSTSFVAGSSVETSEHGGPVKEKRPAWNQAAKPQFARHDLLQYVSRAQEYCSKWRKERFGAKDGLAKKQGSGDSGGRIKGVLGRPRTPMASAASQSQMSSSQASSVEGLEIVGVAPPLTPKPVRHGCRV